MSFCFKWDSCWGQAVFSTLHNQPIHSVWEWGTDLGIHPGNGYGDESVTLMLDDIQRCTRQLLDIKVINKIGYASHRTRSVFWNRGCRGSGPSIDEFRMEAARQLKEAIGSSAGF